MEVTRDQKELSGVQRREFDDLQNEVAGRQTGRQARFLRNGPGSEAAKKKERDAQRALTRLAQLLNDPIYRAKYDGVSQVLSDAERATEAAIDQMNTQIIATQAELDDMMDRAARLPDGTRVFRDANGVVRCEDGSVVEDHLVDTIIWSGNEPSFEEIQATKQRLEDLQSALDDVTRYQNDVLGPSRDKVTDPDDPPSLEGLDSIEDDIQSKMPQIVQEHMPEMTTSALDAPSQSIVLPKLGG